MGNAGSRRGCLKDELEFYKRALDAHAIVAITDPRGAITYVNDKFCEISKYPRSELLAQNHRILNSGHHPRSFFKQMYATIGRGHVWHGEIRNRAKDGGFYWVDTTIVPMLGRSGRPAAYFAIRQDISEQMAAREEILRAKAAAENASMVKSQFIANVSHEIRTPMSAILGFADLIADPTLPSESRCGHIDTIRRNANHLLTVLNDILDMSKIEAGSMEVERIQTDLGGLIRDVLAMMRQHAHAKGIDLSLEIDPAAPQWVDSDPVRLRQILTNLVGNALKFTDAGAVRVRFSPDTDDPSPTGIVISVTDTGIGMNAEQCRIVFQPFTQGDATTTRRFGGTGIGLFVCKRLAELLGGSIKVDSTPGKGSVFSLAIPDIARVSHDLPEAWREPSESIEQMPDRPLAGCRVLLVEDGPDNQRLIRHHLYTAGAAVETAENGRLAINAVQQSPSPFDVVLMDMQMPEMDGYEATRRLRDSGVTTPVIALTAHAMIGDRDECLAAGCDDYLTKPIEATRLIRTCWVWAKGKHPGANTAA